MEEIKRMHFPVTIRLGEATLSPHILLELLAFIVGYRYYLFLKKRTQDAIHAENRIWILAGAAGGAFIFSRLLGALENPASWIGSAHPFLQAFNNRTIVGGLLGGLFGVELVKKLIGEKNSSGDLFTYPIILAMIIGRVGCFLGGIEDNTFGVETNVPWAIDLGDGLYRHPTNLYEILFLAALWVVLVQVEKKYELRSGSRFKLFMVSYLGFRLLIDFIKPYPVFVAGLSSIQLACLAGLIYYYRVFSIPQYLLNKPTHA